MSYGVGPAVVDMVAGLQVILQELRMFLGKAHGTRLNDIQESTLGINIVGKRGETSTILIDAPTDG